MDKKGLSENYLPVISIPLSSKGTSMYYVSTKGGGRGSAKCLLLLMWEEGGIKGFAYVIIFWKIFALETTTNPKKL